VNDGDGPLGGILAFLFLVALIVVMVASAAQH